MLLLIDSAFKKQIPTKNRRLAPIFKSVMEQYLF